MSLPRSRLNLIVITLAATFVLASCGEESSVPMLRNEFEAAVTGKTRDEVLSAVGKPDNTSGNFDYEMWFYDNKTKDPITEKIGHSTVTFQKGRVTTVIYH